MEDRHQIVYQPENPNVVLLAGVFDGHGGEVGSLSFSFERGILESLFFSVSCAFIDPQHLLTDDLRLPTDPFDKED